MFGFDLMSVRRALVDCAVLSLQDPCVFYPCCKSCFSRIDTEQLDGTTRCRCSRCGSRCLRDQVDYRYRLSLRVTRDSCIFDVTVFGNSLNVFFGIHATGLQKLVENLEGPADPSTRSRLLVKAVRDCFIGRHFIFGIKLSGTQSGPWFGDPGSSGSRNRETAQFVASQMILPKAAGLSGCTVLSYYQILLQKASEYEEGSADPAAPLLLVSGTSSSFSDVSLWASGLLSQSQLGPQNPDLSHAPTPLWEQSLGVVTSSAEQEEEGCGLQNGGDDNRRQTEKSTALHPELEKYKVTEKRTSLLPSEQSFCKSPFIRCPNLSFGAADGNSFGVNLCFSPFQPVHKHHSLSQKELSTSQLTRSILSSSSAWEDLPFSESLTEFLHKQNQDFEVLDAIKPLNVQNEKQMARTSLEILNPAVKLTSASQRNTLVRSSHSSVFSDVRPSPGGGDGQDLSDQEHNRPEDENVCPHEGVSENDKAFLSFEEKEEQLEEDSYNCSADLFSNSLRSSRNEETTDAESVRSTCLLYPKTEQQRPREENGVSLTPHKQKLQIKKRNKRGSSTLHGAEHYDFVPPSQSTPVVKSNVVKLSLNWSPRNLTGEISKWSRRSDRCSNRSAPGRRFRKTEKHKKQLQVGQDESLKTIHYELDSRVGHVTVWDLEDDEGIVAPTPDGKRRRSVSSRRRRETTRGSSDLGLIRKAHQRSGVDYQNLFLAQNPTSSHRHGTQTEIYETKAADEASQDGSFDNLLDDSNQICDWSRDLFSDCVPE